jgi:hypothetical protein
VFETVEPSVLNENLLISDTFSANPLKEVSKINQKEN